MIPRVVFARSTGFSMLSPAALAVLLWVVLSLSKLGKARSAMLLQCVINLIAGALLATLCLWSLSQSEHPRLPC